MNKCPEKFCMEGKNKGKPGPCPDPEKAKRRSGPASNVGTGPTNAAPGSEDKIKVMQARFAKGIPLFDPKDGSAPATKPTRKSPVAKAATAAPKKAASPKAPDVASAAKSYESLRGRAGEGKATFQDYEAEVGKLAKLPHAGLKKVAESVGVGHQGLTKTQLLTSMKRQLQDFDNLNGRFEFTKSPPKSAPKQAVPKPSLAESSKEIATIHDNAAKPETTQRQIDEAVSRLKATKPSLAQLRAVANSIGITQKFTHDKTLAAIHSVISERKGRAVRVLV